MLCRWCGVDAALCGRQLCFGVVWFEWIVCSGGGCDGLQCDVSGLMYGRQLWYGVNGLYWRRLWCGVSLACYTGGYCGVLFGVV